ncbi:Uncharacterised protein [Vibrio cholerae]|nr:Uncharacterised protein [Vibrio cholerae]
MSFFFLITFGRALGFHFIRIAWHKRFVWLINAGGIDNLKMFRYLSQIDSRTANINHLIN